mgnify:CR=1 FL=1
MLNVLFYLLLLEVQKKGNCRKIGAKGNTRWSFSFEHWLSKLGGDRHRLLSNCRPTVTMPNEGCKEPIIFTIYITVGLRLP